MRYMKGDATRPQGEGPKVIVHICNNVGGWGAGFVLAVSRRWSTPEQTYRRQTLLELGSIQLVQVEPDLFVANMVAQAGYGTTRVKHRSDSGCQEDMLPAIRYWALEQCLEKVADVCAGGKMSVHMPRIGCALAGGSWTEVEKIVDRALSSRGIDVTVYDFPGSKFNP